MDFERLERVWRSNANSMTEAAYAYLMEDIMQTLQRRRRGFVTFMVMVGLALSGWTAKIGYDALTRPFPFDLAREWSLILLLALPWAALAVIGLQYRRQLRAHPDPYGAMPDTLRALVDDNAGAQRRVRFMAVMMAAGVVMLAVALGQLAAVGKMTPRDVFQGSLLFGGVLAVVWGAIAVDYFRRLKPEGARLRRLLEEYGA